jgi:hypothetical protein
LIYWLAIELKTVAAQESNGILQIETWSRVLGIDISKPDTSARDSNGTTTIW